MSTDLSPATAEQTLAAWLARDAEVRALRLQHGLARREQVAGKSGMELFEAMLRGEVPSPPIGRTLDFLLAEFEPGRVQFQGRPCIDHYNPLGSVHGGWIAALLDSAMACAIHTLLPAGKSYTTLEIKVNYVKALTDRVPMVRAIGEVIHSGRQIGTSHGRLVGPDGTLFAHATTTCMCFDAPPEAPSALPPGGAASGPAEPDPRRPLADEASIARPTLK